MRWLLLAAWAGATPVAAQAPDTATAFLEPAAVFDGDSLRTGWIVAIRGDRITAAGPAPGRGAAVGRRIALPGLTLLPGLIEAHSHLLLHPYDETSWNDQVLKESLSLRVARATVHARKTLLAGFTTVRDLGTEGADYADVGLKQAVDQGVIPGPRIITTTRAIVATGSYAPKGFDPRWEVPQGAEEADGVDELIKVVRRQIGKGADWIKVYADYRWGPDNQARPTFSVAELTAIVETARSSGRHVVAHASTAEGMRRAALAGVKTIDHGDDATAEVFRLMRERGVAFCPTIAAGDAIERYRGWRPRRRPRTRADPAQAGLVSACSRIRGGDLQWKRRGGLRPWRQRPRDRADGRVWSPASGGPQGRHQWQRRGVGPAGSGPGGGRPVGGFDRGGGRPDQGGQSVAASAVGHEGWNGHHQGCAMNRIAVFLGAACWASPLSAQTLTSAEIRRIDSVFAPFDGTSRPGCALGVSRDGRSVYQRGYGMADLQNGVAISPQSIFHVASVSKQFAAFAVALLAEDGKLSLDDEVRKYLTELPDYGSRVTIRQLIYHTSGVRDHWELLGMAGWRYPDDVFTQQDVLDIVTRQKALNFTPGDEYLYSNGGYTLLAVIVERVSGKSLRQFSEERIFAPLAMTRTHVHDDHNMIVPGRTSAYQMGKDGWRISVPSFDTHGATSLFTTVGDLLKWQQNFVTATVGNARLLREAETTAVLNSGKPANYGFGISIEKYRGTPAFGHGGSDAGYRADVVRFPEHRLGIAVACNFADATPNVYARAVAEVVLDGKLAPKPAGSQPGAVTLAPARLAQLAGVYKARTSDQVLRLVVKEGRLVIENFGIPMEPVDDNHFVVFGTPVSFAGPATGLPTALFAEALGDSMMRMPPFTPPVGRLGEFAGDYWSDEVQSWYRIGLPDSALVLRRLKFGAETLSPVFPDAFLLGGGGGTVRFVRTKGKVTGFLLTGGRVRNVAFARAADRR